LGLHGQTAIIIGGSVGSWAAGRGDPPEFPGEPGPFLWALLAGAGSVEQLLRDQGLRRNTSDQAKE